MRPEVNLKPVWSFEPQLEHVYMRPKVNSNRFEISNHFEKSFRLHGNFTASNLEISNRFKKLSRYMEISLWQLSKP